jgi:hypothetical protein
MLYKAIILSLGILTLINCHAQKRTKPHVVTTKTKESMNMEGNIIYFKEGENRFLKEYEMNVTFKGVSEDSRCPKDVTCIWAGTAVAQVEVMGPATRPVILNLATAGHERNHYGSSANFNGYTISLAELMPYPAAQDEAKALTGKYKIGIIIKKAEETSDSTMK